MASQGGILQQVRQPAAFKAAEEKTMSELSTRSVLLYSGNEAIADFAQFIWVGGTLYKWSDMHPQLAFKQGLNHPENSGGSLL